MKDKILKALKVVVIITIILIPILGIVIIWTRSIFVGQILLSDMILFLSLFYAGKLISDE